MRTIIVGLLMLVMFGFSVTKEPVVDTVDAIAGSSTEIYGPTVDGIAGVSLDDDDEDDEEDDD